MAVPLKITSARCPLTCLREQRNGFSASIHKSGSFLRYHCVIFFFDLLLLGL